MFQEAAPCLSCTFRIRVCQGHLPRRTNESEPTLALNQCSKIQVHDRPSANHRCELAQQSHTHNLELYITSVANVMFIIAIYHNLKNVAYFYYHMHVTN